MYLLYLDGSGSVKNPGERYFVLAGISVFERQIYHLITKADEYVATVDAVGGAELHGSVMNKGSKSPWKGMARKDRLAAIEGGLDILRDAHNSVRAFAVAVDKQVISPDDPVEYAFEELCNRFDLYLSRLWSREGEKHRGLVVMDESHYEGTSLGIAVPASNVGSFGRCPSRQGEVPAVIWSAANCGDGVATA